MENFTCGFKSCNFSSNNRRDVLYHTLFSHSIDFNFETTCCFSNCKKKFTSFQKFFAHVEYNTHNAISSNYNLLTCDLHNCNQSFNNLEALKFHYYEHLEENSSEIPLKCIYKNCDYQCHAKNASKKHFSVRHRHLTYESLRKEFFINHVNDTLDQSNDNDFVLNNGEDHYEFNGDYIGANSMNMTSNISLKGHSREQIEEFIMKFYLKLNAKYLVPKSTCEFIFSSCLFLTSFNNNAIVDDLKDLRDKYNSNNPMDDIYFNHIQNHSLLYEVQQKFKSDYNRTKWIESHPLYVGPIEIKLDLYDDDEHIQNLDALESTSSPTFSNIRQGDDLEEDDDSLTQEQLFSKYKYVLKGRLATFQYVPILKTISTLLKHPDIVEAYFKNIPTHFDDIEIKSYYNSQVFKTKYIDLLVLTINGIQLVFFIDGYSNTNPLADARRNYKTTGVYFRIGNLPKQYQSVDYFTQLAIIVYDSQLKYYGYDKIFKQLIDDLLILERKGLDVEYKGEIINLKGTISLIAQDNLAGNGIGGFVESFGSNMHCKSYFL